MNSPAAHATAEHRAAHAGAAGAAAPGRLGTGALAGYAAFGLPLALLATPVNLFVPALYEQSTTLSLALIGVLLFATRLVDALVDPLLGAWVDAQKRTGQYWRPILLASLPMTAGFIALLNPPAGMGTVAAALWLSGSIVLVYLAYSLATVAYQGWGSELATDDAGRTRVTASREGLGLVGVIVASILFQQAGLPALVGVFVVLMALGLLLLGRFAPRPPAAAGAPADGRHGWAVPLASGRVRWLLAIFTLNALAPSITATLFQFFVTDKLGLSQHIGSFLALYFLAGALSMPAWVWLARRFDLQGLWLAGMAASIASFVWAFSLGPGDFTGFAVICLLSGLAFGADLAIPPALLARVIDANQHRGEREGVYFGLWNFANKLVFSLAALIALPLLQSLGYSPGSTAPGPLQALTLSYAVVPCVLKLLAFGLLAAAWRGSRL
ncbi:MAG TPA: MFS transporter [Burkholderiaceae bacterium]|nr:MFS transporter [Burkholderiaceae bacterium]